MQRDLQLKQLENTDIVWDILVIGGGATGLGVALDATLRGYKVILVEASDFAKGTSSRSTKLVHGGVRYLAKGDIGLVMEALHERGLLKRNAAHLVKNQTFIIPVYTWWDAFLYTVGLTFYDLLAGRLGFGKSLFMGPRKVLEWLPALNKNRLKGGVLYHDGQFDDSRLAVNMTQSVIEHGGCAINYVKAISLLKDAGGKLTGAEVNDLETGKTHRIQARTVVNATGVFVDSILRLDNPELMHMVRPSQGVHIVMDKKFLGSDYSLMIPKTDDGRVLFAIPWHGKAVIGTTDTVVDSVEPEPRALREEIDFILNNAGRYLTSQPTRNDILSVFAGLRPLAAPSQEGKSTKEISRKHKLMVSGSGLITITGGKWTTYRKMAEDTVNTAIKTGGLIKRPCATRTFAIHGSTQPLSENDVLSVYGTDAVNITHLLNENPEWGNKLHPAYDYIEAQVIWAVREEMARTVEDVLARRLRILFLDVQASTQMCVKVAEIMARELKKDNEWIEAQVQQFEGISKNYKI